MRHLLALPLLLAACCAPAHAMDEDEGMDTTMKLAQEFWQLNQAREVTEADFDALWAKVPQDFQLWFALNLVAESPGAKLLDEAEAKQQELQLRLKELENMVTHRDAEVQMKQHVIAELQEQVEVLKKRLGEK